MVVLGLGLSGLVTALYWHGIRQVDSSKGNKRTLISTEYESPHLPPQQAAEIDPFHDLLEAEGFTFRYHVENFYGSINSSVIESVYYNADSTISVATLGRIGDMPPGMELRTVFADDAMLLTTAPFGECVDAPKLHARHAYDLLAAIDYHHMQVMKMEPKHGPALPCLTFEEFERHEDLYKQNYRSYFFRRMRNHLRGQFNRGLAATGMIALLAIGDVLYALGFFTPERDPNVGTVLLLLTMAILFGFLGINTRYETLFQRFPGAIDEGVNPPPIIGGVSATKKQR